MARARIPPEAAGQRIDHVVAAAVPGLSVAAARRLLLAGAVRIDGRRPRKGAKVGAGEAGAGDGDRRRGAGGRWIDRRACAIARRSARGGDGAVFEDAALIAIAKPAGMPSHPLAPGQLRHRGQRDRARASPSARPRRPIPARAAWSTGWTRAPAACWSPRAAPRVWPALRAALTGRRLREDLSGRGRGRARRMPGWRPRRSAASAAAAGACGSAAAASRWRPRQPGRWSSGARRPRCCACGCRRDGATRCARTWPPRGFRSSGDATVRRRPGEPATATDAELHLHAASVRFRHPISGETILIEAPPPEWAMIRA